MECEKTASSDSFENDLISKIIFCCLKKCLNRCDISSETKMKILFLLYENNVYSPVTHDSLYEENLNATQFNPLGVDDDLLNSSPSILTPNQIDELRRLVLDEVRVFHSFCSMLKSGILPLTVKQDVFESLDLLQNNWKEVNADLELSSKLLQQSKTLQLEALKLPLEFKKKVISKASKLYLVERALLEEIDRAISEGERREALEKVEHILEKKVLQNEEKINDLKFQISEYYA